MSAMLRNLGRLPRSRGGLRESGHGPGKPSMAARSEVVQGPVDSPSAPSAAPASHQAPPNELEVRFTALWGTLSRVPLADALPILASALDAASSVLQARSSDASARDATDFRLPPPTRDQQAVCVEADGGKQSKDLVAGADGLLDRIDGLVDHHEGPVGAELPSAAAPSPPPEVSLPKSPHGADMPRPPSTPSADDHAPISVGDSTAALALAGCKRLRIDSFDYPMATKAPPLRLHLRIISKPPLGEGSYGEVVTCLLANGTEVAVKRAHFKKHQPDIVARAFESELRALRAAGTHPNVVELLGVGEPAARDKIAPIVMALAPGGSLLDRLRKHGPLHPYVAYHAFVGALKGICHLHERGIVHGDVKPDNLFYGDNGDVRVGDLGSALHIVPGEPFICVPASRVTYSAGYMPPEAFPSIVGAGCRISEKLDSWTLGTTLAVMLRGARVPDGAMYFLPAERGTPNLVDFCIPELPGAPADADSDLEDLVKGLAQAVTTLRTVSVDDRPTLREFAASPLMEHLLILAGCPEALSTGASLL